MFESSVNSYGRKTDFFILYNRDKFESSVNSYGRKTTYPEYRARAEFESSVNSYGRKTQQYIGNSDFGLRVV